MLAGKHLVLFQCCMNVAEAETNYKTAFPEGIRNRAEGHFIVGGEYLFDEMSQLERDVIVELAGVETSVSRLDFGKIATLVSLVKRF